MYNFSLFLKQTCESDARRRALSSGVDVLLTATTRHIIVDTETYFYIDDRATLFRPASARTSPAVGRK